MPSIRRCLAWGRLLRQAIESLSRRPLRVAVLGTGGFEPFDRRADHGMDRRGNSITPCNRAASRTVRTDGSPQFSPRTRSAAHRQRRARDPRLGRRPPAAAGSKGFELIDYFPSPQTLVGAGFCVVATRPLPRRREAGFRCNGGVHGHGEDCGRSARSCLTLATSPAAFGPIQISWCGGSRHEPNARQMAASPSRACGWTVGGYTCAPLSALALQARAADENDRSCTGSHTRALAPAPPDARAAIVAARSPMPLDQRVTDHRNLDDCRRTRRASRQSARRCSMAPPRP